MNNDGSGPSTVRLGVSPFLQGLAALALLVWIAAQVYPFVWGDKKVGAPAAKAKEQMVYMMSPGNTGSLRELGGLLDQGWRVTQVSAAGCPLEQAPSHRILMVVEDPKTKEHNWWYINPYAPDSPPASLRAQLKAGHKITQVSSAATAASAGWTYQTVYVLER
jgi:hypothetical protein